MSRTYGHGTGNKRNGVKRPYFEYWSRRPGPIDPTKKSRIITHRIERAREKMMIKKILKEGLFE